MRTAVGTTLLLVVTPALHAGERGADQVGKDLFTSKVRPILTRHCLACHGPDEEARKAKLRLDVRDEAVRAASSGVPPIVPGDPDESELVRRIYAEDEDERMPPPGVKNPLSDEEKQVLKRW